MSKCGALDMGLPGGLRCCWAYWTNGAGDQGRVTTVTRHAPRRRGIQYAADSRINHQALEYWIARSSRAMTVGGSRERPSDRPVAAVRHHDRSGDVGRQIGREENRGTDDV